ncbi:DNA helicase-2 / ATP-dependent DNA helicase PcrA [Lachnospiraceae bacterium KHCPX20]|nr:DNA helicase-2 / ATP-dependent DNA helicase PcrA [Lachnospiraceae bacterium KHCPX20]
MIPSCSFSADQMEAVTHGKGPALCLAGPGSGKTMVLTGRIRYLVDALSVDPSRILVVTFTKDAASSIKRRYQQTAVGSSMPFFGTFHSIFYTILRQIPEMRSYQVISGQMAISLLHGIMKEHQIKGYKEENLPEFLRAISCYRNGSVRNESPFVEGIRTELFFFVMEEYQKAKEREGLLDFDDMLFRAREILTTDPSLLEKWQKRFEYILVDEAQDMNAVQYETICLLSRPQNNLFLVGDDDQAIYGFRGSSPEFLLNFSKDFPEADILFLHKNYRCGNRIVSASLQLISNNKKRMEKDIVGVGATEGVIRVLESRDATEEAHNCFHLIQRLVAKGVKKEEIAVLYRNHSQARLLHELLSNTEKEKEQKDSLDGFATEDLVSYLRVCLDAADRKDFLRTISHPNRGFLRFGLEEEQVYLEEWLTAQKKGLQGEKAKTFVRDLRTISMLSPWAAINYVRKGMGYDDYLQNEAQKRGLPKDLYLKQADALLMMAKEYRNIAAFLHEVDRLFMQRAEMKKAPSHGKEQGVAFHTFHGCKGLEFDTVIILGACEGITPSKKINDAAGLEEERRLFYVAMTRAKRQLILSVIGHKSNEVLYPSRFVKEAFG